MNSLLGLMQHLFFQLRQIPTLFKFWLSSPVQLPELVAQKNGAYSERNKVISLAAKMAIALNLDAEIWQHDESDEDWEDDWRNIVAIELPTGWVTWHINDSERSLFDFLPDGENKWDGHTTEEKYRRVVEANF